MYMIQNHTSRKMIKKWSFNFMKTGENSCSRSIVLKVNCPKGVTSLCIVTLKKDNHTHMFAWHHLSLQLLSLLNYWISCFTLQSTFVYMINKKTTLYMNWSYRDTGFYSKLGRTSNKLKFSTNGRHCPKSQQKPSIVLKKPVVKNLSGSLLQIMVGVADLFIWIVQKCQ